MADLISMLMASGTEGEATDVDFQNTVLLLHGDGTNGAQNNTFLDSSTNNFTITRNGNTTQGTFSPFSKPDGRWGNYFDGTDDYLSVADNAVLRPGAGAFTLEAWIYRGASGAAHTIYAKGGASTGISFLVTSGNVLRFTHTTTNIDSSGTVSANAWVHVAVVREGTGTNQTKLYINGTQDGQGTVSTDFTQTEEVRIGTNRSAGDDFNGYISNVRFVKGSALYTGNFTPSTSPLTTTSQGASSSEVELLTCQSNRFIDNSSNNFAITVNGDVKVTPFSPFPITTAYDPAVNGGAGYFDGSGDYLTAPDNAAFDLPNDFTLEGWVYFGGLSANREIFGLGSENAAQNGFAFYWAAGAVNKLRLYSNGATVITCSTTLVANTWYHLAIVRNGSGSNNLVIYVNGVSDGTATNTTSFTGVANNGFAVGANYASSYISAMLGYISNVRLTKSAVYTSAFTPPTAPLTAIANTSLLTNFTNAGIFDNTGFNALETVGDAQIDTTTKKYGTGSMEFDGTGDWLIAPANPLFNLGTENFTIEGWFYFNTTASNQYLLGTFAVSPNRSWFLYFDTSLKMSFTYSTTGSNATDAAFGYTPSTSTWVHMAVVRNGADLKFYANGTQEGSTHNISTSSIYANNQPLYIGERGTATGAAFNGYIDDLRITKGIARYTTTFTPPTAAFPDIGD